MSFKTQKNRPSGLRVNRISGYPLPFIDDVSINGGLNYLALKADPTLEVIVNCGPFLPAVAGDRIDLYWKGSDGIERKVASRTFNVGEIMASFPIPVAVALQAHEGPGEIRYTYTDSAATYPAEPLECLIKTTVPGNPYSAPNLPETFYINEAMLAPTVVPLAIDQGNVGSGATVTIAAWTNMFKGDILTLNWGGYPIKQPALTDTQPGQPVVIKVSEEDIRAAGNSAEVQVSYEIRDLVNNWSLNSPATLVDVNTDLNLLDAPDVIDVDAGKLNFDALEGRVSLTIVATPAPIFSVGDGVTLYWKGTNAQGAVIEKSYELDVTSTTGRLQFKVPNADVALFIGGSVTSVSYTLASSFTGELEVSRSLMFAVIGTQLDLPAPQLENGLVGGVFEPVTLPSTGALISLPPYPGMAADDRIILSWKGLNSKGDPLHGSDDQTLEDSDVGTTFIFTIDKSELLPLGDATKLTFFYIVIFALSEGLRSSAPVTYDVKQRALIKPNVPLAYGADLDRLNFDDMYNDIFLTVEVPHSTHMLPDDKVRLTWEGSVIYYSDTITINEPDTLTFTIPRLEVIDIIGRSTRITYTLYHLDKTAYESDELILHVDAYPIDLPAPRINDLKVTVYYPDITDGDKGRVRWSGVVVHDTQEQYLEAGRVEEFNIPSAWFSESEGTAVLINYSVLTDRDSERLMFSRVLRINL